MDGARPAEGFSSEVVGSFWSGTISAVNVGTFHHQKKRVPDRSCEERTAGGATRDAAQGEAQTCSAQQ